MTTPASSLPSARPSRPPAGTGRVLRFALLSFVGWSLLAAIPTTSAYIGTGAQGFAIWWAMFKKIGFYYYMWGLLTPLIYRLTDALPVRGSGLFVTVPTHLGVFVVLSFTLGLIAHQEAWREWLLGQRAVGYHAMSAFTYALVVLCCLAVKFYRLSLLREREAREARVLAAQLDSKLNLARVDSLRMQLNPHFLFNALNSVAALIETREKEAAYQAVEQLGDLLRQALKLSTSETVLLDDELRFAEAYLTLEQLRFGPRLEVTWGVSDEARQQAVPAFVLQPLIENAVRHAVGPSSKPVAVTIRAELDASHLRLTVKDDASETATRTAGAGVGLTNLRERLQLRYAGEARVAAGPRNPGFEARIELPRN